MNYPAIRSAVYLIHAVCLLLGMLSAPEAAARNIHNSITFSADGSKACWFEFEQGNILNLYTLPFDSLPYYPRAGRAPQRLPYNVREIHLSGDGKHLFWLHNGSLFRASPGDIKDSVKVAGGFLSFFFSVNYDGSKVLVNSETKKDPCGSRALLVLEADEHGLYRVADTLLEARDCNFPRMFGILGSGDIYFKDNHGVHLVRKQPNGKYAALPFIDPTKYRHLWLTHSSRGNRIAFVAYHFRSKRDSVLGVFCCEIGPGGAGEPQLLYDDVSGKRRSLHVGISPDGNRVIYFVPKEKGDNNADRVLVRTHGNPGWSDAQELLADDHQHSFLSGAPMMQLTDRHILMRTSGTYHDLYLYTSHAPGGRFIRIPADENYVKAIRQGERFSTGGPSLLYGSPGWQRITISDSLMQGEMVKTRLAYTNTGSDTVRLHCRFSSPQLNGYKWQAHRYPQYDIIYDQPHVDFTVPPPDTIAPGDSIVYEVWVSFYDSWEIVAIDARLEGKNAEPFRGWTIKSYLVFLPTDQRVTALKTYFNGRPLEQMTKHGNAIRYTSWYPNGNISSETQHTGIKSSGTWRLCTEDGRELRRKTFRSDDEYELCTWYPNGQLRSKGVYKKKCKSGEWLEYHPNGQLKSRADFRAKQRMDRGFWVMNSVPGIYEEWYANGQKKGEAQYAKDGTRSGVWKAWHANGVLASERTYKDGNLLQVQVYDMKGAPCTQQCSDLLDALPKLEYREPRHIPPRHF